MNEVKWSAAEKKLARQMFRAALNAEFAEIIADFKTRAGALVEPEEMWAIEDYLHDKRLEVDRK